MFRRNGVASSCEPCRKSKIRCDHIQPVCQKCQKRGRASECYYHPAPLSRSTEQGNAELSNTVTVVALTPQPTPTSSSFHSPSQTSPIGRNVRPKLSASRSTALKCLDADIKLLELLQPVSLFQDLLTGFFEISQTSAVPEPFIMSALPVLRTQLESCITPEDQLDLFNLISQNTTIPFKVEPDMSPRDFHTLFTGINIRWEFIGLIFALGGLATLVLPPSNPTFITSPHLDTTGFIINMISASNTCVSICQQSGAENEIMLWALVVNSHLISNFYGDTSQALWRRFGDIISDAFSMGLHRAPEGPAGPFFLQEIRKKLFSTLYRGDKSLATFLGRPPRVPRHYCDIQMPLDLADKDLMLEGPDLEAALARLDENGWNTARNIRRSSFLRTRYMLSMFREEILEYINCPFTEEIRAKLYKLLEDLPKTWESIPSYLRYDDTCWERFPKTSTCMCLLSCFLDYWHSQFLIQRHLAKNLPIARPELIKISMHILTTVLIVISKRNFVMGETHFVRDFPWFICAYGLPSAGVLTTELRHCVLSGALLEPSISRSQLIRNLSLLIAALGWVDEPDHRYYKLCRDAFELLGNMLDEALNHQPKQVERMADVNEAADPQQEQPYATTALDVTFPMDGENFLAWLDSVDWNTSMPAF